jgi:GNAT superfamily N-acetyltransferase
MDARMRLEVKEVSGATLEPYLEGLGGLRIRVFREWPYLYDGSLDYERNYLRRYVDCARSLVTLVLDEGQLVGATTCMPMVEEEREFQKPFLEAGFDLSKVLYLGESILLPPYRGRGLGKDFFARREAHAERLGCEWTAFCAVDRREDDPRRPVSYRALDGLWRQRGYTRRPELKATFEWREIGELTDTPKTMTFWTREWAR